MAVVYVHSPVEVIIPSDNGVTVDIPQKALVVPVPSGARGLPGVSPTVSTSPIEGGTEVTIHYEDGETSFDVMNGEAGAKGDQGEPGEGVASGGTTGQVLAKRSNADYDTEWVNQSAGGVTSVNGQTGAVTLDASDVGALPDSYTAPVQSVNGQVGAVQIPTISLLDAYPVGSIYMSVNSTSPATLFGGTWERIQDTFLMAAGTTYAGGSTGGEAEHTLTVDEMPSHTHYTQGWVRPGNNTSAYTGSYTRTASDPINTNTPNLPTGGNQPHNNMPPYLAVYVWKRAA